MCVVFFKISILNIWQQGGRGGCVFKQSWSRNAGGWGCKGRGVSRDFACCPFKPDL